MASLKSDCGVKFGPAQRKGLLMWQQVFIVLRPEDDTLYEFRTDLVRNTEPFIWYFIGVYIINSLTLVLG